MSRQRIYLCLAHMSDSAAEQKYVKEAFDTNWVVPLGPNVDAFEQDLQQFISPQRQVVALSSGTAAVHLALIGCGVQPGDEVMVQSFTFCASSNPIAYLGAKPVFVDSEDDTWNMSPEILELAIQDRLATTGRLPKAIIPVALYGMPYHIDRILDVASRYDIPVIEDAAEGFGSSFKGHRLGSFGRYGVLSFNGNKMITTSGGGALVVSDEEAKRHIMWLATQARESYPYYQHEAIGFNYRLSNICAGIGRGQMTVVEQHLAHHRHIADLYRKAFAEIDGITYHDSSIEGSNFWLSTILLSPDLVVRGQEQAYCRAGQCPVGDAAGVAHSASSLRTSLEPNPNVEAMRLWLDNAMVESRPLWKPMHTQPVYCRGSKPVAMDNSLMPSLQKQEGLNMAAYVNGTSEAIFRQGLCLPSGPCVTDEDIAYIVDTIRQAIV